MKKLILSLFSLFSVFAGVPHCLGNPASEEVRASQPNRERRHGAYSKDNWTVYYRGPEGRGALRHPRSPISAAGTARTTGRCSTAAGRWTGRRPRRSRAYGNGMAERTTGIPIPLRGAATARAVAVVGRKARRRLLRRTAGRCITAAGRWTGRFGDRPSKSLGRRIRQGPLEGILSGARAVPGASATDVRRARVEDTPGTRGRSTTAAKELPGASPATFRIRGAGA